MSNKGITSKYLTAAGVVYDGPCRWWGWSVCSSVSGDGATLYEGHDANSGSILEHVEASDTITFAHMLPRGRYCPRGLYLAVDAGLTHGTIFYEPVAENE